MFKLWVVEIREGGKLQQQFPVFAVSAEDAVAKAKEMRSYKSGNETYQAVGVQLI